MITSGQNKATCASRDLAAGLDLAGTPPTPPTTLAVKTGGRVRARELRRRARALPGETRWSNGGVARRCVGGPRPGARRARAEAGRFALRSSKLLTTGSDRRWPKHAAGLDRQWSKPAAGLRWSKHAAGLDRQNRRAGSGGQNMRPGLTANGQNRRAGSGGQTRRAGSAACGQNIGRRALRLTPEGARIGRSRSKDVF